MSTFNMVASMNESTVVAEYTPQSRRSDSYQSETELEKDFISMLCEQGYEYLQIHDEAGLVSNLRNKIEQLNSYSFTNAEWTRFFQKYIANANESIVEKTRTIQEDAIKNLERDDGSTKNITLIDKKNIHNNRLQVLNQYEVSRGNNAYPVDRQANYDNRYDVTILVNGFPLVHVELKRRGVAIREAFNQISRYQRDSFWAESGLFEYVQIFIISNGTHTKYYSNTTRSSHLDEQKKNNRTSNNSKKTSNSFEFTSFWADANNKVISDLVDFTKTFLSKHTLLNILTKYCVFTSEELLLVMRPYQIAATEKILSRIEIATNYKKMGTLEAGGYIWHTTGSGKTLTSFKTAQLASKLPFVDKVIFVVDRKDLDYQTMKEYDRFQKGAANSNTSTAVLKRQLEDEDARIIITTIQKLDHFVRKNKGHKVFEKHMVLIFDECHRSQFGDMHEAITKNFRKYYIFGFTGTPIFADNAGTGKKVNLHTTPQVFGDKLHTYTIVDAINDGNVLPFRIDYITTIKDKERTRDKQVSAIDTEKALMEPQRIAEIVKYILEHFDQKTKRNKESFGFSKLMNVQEVAEATGSRAKKRNLVEEKKQPVHMRGFNSIFAVSSIDAAKLYYTEFKKQMAGLPETAPTGHPHRLRVATIYSYGVNEAESDDFVEDENSENTDGLDKGSRDFLEMAIHEYNDMFRTNYDTSSDKFQNYYKDVSLRMKNREIDILIVVNMFLTGFDATTLNTLWADKNLKYHGLLQAFSRTNRILNSVKTFGNIVCFRNLEQETNDAIALFGDKEAGSVVLLKNFESYYHGYDENGRHYDGYVELIDRLNVLFPLGVPLMGEKAEKEFISLYGAILRMKNILATFDSFEGQEILSDRDFQDYQSAYIDLYQKYKPKADEKKENINDDVVFEIELVKQVEINIDYILMLVKKYQQDGNQDKEIIITIEKAVNSSMNLRSKMELIRNFLSKINAQTEVDGDWKQFVDEQREDELAVIIYEEKLKAEETHRFIDNSFRDGVLKITGTDIDVIMPAVSRFGGGNRIEKKKRVIDRLMAYYEKYLELVSKNSD